MRTFTRCFAAVVALVVMMALPGWCQQVVSTAPTMTHADSMVAIDLLAKKIAAANPQYPKPYESIPIGVLIHVPTAQGPQVFYKTEPWQYGQLGCYWHIAAYHLFGKRMSPPDTTVAVAPVIAQPTALERFLNALQAFWNSFWWLLLLLAIAIAILLYMRRERQLDARRDPPMVRGGLSENPQVALEQIQAATRVHHGGNRQVVSVQRGHLHNTSGQRRTVITRVEFGDGIIRRKRLEQSMICWQVVVRENGQEQTEYWLNHCGNRVAERKDGRFDLPDGWEFVPEPAVAARVHETEQIATAAAQGVVDHATQQAETNGREYKVTLEVQNGHPTPTTYTVTSEGGRFIKGFEVTKAGTLRVDL